MFSKIDTYGEIANRTIGVNLAVFDGVLATADINMPPLRGLIPFLPDAAINIPSLRD